MYEPTIPARVRTVIYAIGLIVGTLAVAVRVIAPIVIPDHAGQIIGVTDGLTASAAFLAGATGVAYRPTANPTVADGTAVPVEEDPPPVEPYA